MFSLHSVFFRVRFKQTRSLYLLFICLFMKGMMLLILLRINYLVKGLEFQVLVLLGEEGKAKLHLGPLIFICVPILPLKDIRQQDQRKMKMQKATYILQASFSFLAPFPQPYFL